MASGRVSKVKGKVLDIPNPPTIGTATAGAESATVAFTASTKGGPVSTYTALSNPGSVTGSGTSSPVTVSGLTAGTAYTFTVRGNNVTGSSEYSSASNSITPTVGSSYESIATYTVGGTAQSNITFSSIPSTYKHLQLRGVLNTSTATNPKFYYNTDVTTNGNYRGHHLWSTGGASNANDNTVNYFNYNPSTSYPSVFVMDILDYASTTKTKTARIIAASDTNGGTSEVAVWSSLWFISPIQAINQIVLQGNGADFNQYSQIALYGIRG